MRVKAPKLKGLLDLKKSQRPNLLYTCRPKTKGRGDKVGKLTKVVHEEIPNFEMAICRCPAQTKNSFSTVTFSPTFLSRAHIENTKTY